MSKETRAFQSAALPARTRGQTTMHSPISDALFRPAYHSLHILTAQRPILQALLLYSLYPGPQNQLVHTGLQIHQVVNMIMVSPEWTDN